MKREIWATIHVEQDLQWLSRLSPNDVYEILIRLKHSRTPSLKLAYLVNKFGLDKRAKIQQNIAHDAKIIKNPKCWKSTQLRLIYQLWVSELFGQQHAAIFSTDPLTVTKKSNNEQDTTFATAEEMLAIWRLD